MPSKPIFTYLIRLMTVHPNVPTPSRRKRHQTSHLFEGRIPRKQIVKELAQGTFWGSLLAS